MVAPRSSCMGSGDKPLHKPITYKGFRDEMFKVAQARENDQVSWWDTCEIAEFAFLSESQVSISLRLSAVEYLIVDSVRKLVWQPFVPIISTHETASVTLFQTVWRELGSLGSRVESTWRALNVYGLRVSSRQGEVLKRVTGFCRLCYEARDSEGLKAVEQRARNSSIHNDNTCLTALFVRTRHFIGRIGSHWKAASILVEAGKHYPQLFTGYPIEIAAKHLHFKPPSYRGKSSINGIVNRMVTDPQACQYYQKKLQSQDEKFHLLLEERIRDE